MREATWQEIRKRKGFADVVTCVIDVKASYSTQWLITPYVLYHTIPFEGERVFFFKA